MKPGNKSIWVYLGKGWIFSLDSFILAGIWLFCIFLFKDLSSLHHRPSGEACSPVWEAAQWPYFALPWDHWSAHQMTVCIHMLVLVFFSHFLIFVGWFWITFFETILLLIEYATKNGWCGLFLLVGCISSKLVSVPFDVSGGTVKMIWRGQVSWKQYRLFSWRWWSRFQWRQFRQCRTSRNTLWTIWFEVCRNIRRNMFIRYNCWLSFLEECSHRSLRVFHLWDRSYVRGLESHKMLDSRFKRYNWFDERISHQPARPAPYL